MSGRIGTSIDNAVSAQVVRPALLAEFDFSDGMSRVWSGVGTLSWDGKSWLGLGTLGSVDGIEETTELRAVGVRFKLSGIPAELLTSVTTTVTSGRKAKLWMAFLTDYMTVIDTPVLLLSGKMDTIDITDGGDTLSFELAVESNLRDLQRPRTRRYTDGDQQSEFPGDKGFEFVSELQRKQFKWGTKSPPGPPVTWSSTAKAASISLNDNKLVATQGASGSDGVRATSPSSTYFEVYVSSGTAAAGVSAAIRDTENLTFDGSNAWGSSVKNAGTIICVAVDNGNLYIGIDGVWDYDEELGTPVPTVSGISGTVFPTAALVNATSTVTGRFKWPWWHSPPPWMTWMADSGASGDGSMGAGDGVGDF